MQRFAAFGIARGRAIFHLNGAGKPANLKLPAIGFGGGKRLIVQAETDANGRTFYGVVERHGVRKVSATEFWKVTPSEDLP